MSHNNDTAPGMACQPQLGQLTEIPENPGKKKIPEILSLLSAAFVTATTQYQHLPNQPALQLPVEMARQSTIVS